MEWYDSGIGFAVPLFGLDILLERMKSGERIQPAFLGIQPLSSPKGEGVMIQEVVPDSPVADAGFKSADVILKVNGDELKDVMALRLLLSQREAGDKIDIEYRDGESDEIRSVTIELTTPPVDDNVTVGTAQIR
ncbi:MAG: S1C family serine protease [Pirellulaceae bacterium]